MPDVTMVAAWISAETGVGPAMASGSHRYSGNWADLPIAPTNSITAMNVAVDSATLPASAASSTSTYDSDPNVKNTRHMATITPQSPIRLVTNAFFPAVALAGSVNQNEISRYEQAPTPSQPRKVSSRLSPSTSTSMAKANRLR